MIPNWLIAKRRIWAIFEIKFLLNSKVSNQLLHCIINFSDDLEWYLRKSILNNIITECSFKWNIRASFYLFSFSQWKWKFETIAQSWNRTSNLRWRKLQLNQLSHNRCPPSLFSVWTSLESDKFELEFRLIRLQRKIQLVPLPTFSSTTTAQ